MSLIQCPECGKEISDKSEFCINCGYPIAISIHKDDTKNRVVEEYEDLEENTQIFDCIECGRPLPVGIKKCIYCEHKYTYNSDIKRENYTQTGRFGRKNIICPKCGSRSFKVLNDVPIHKKIGDIIAFGTVSEVTKNDYRGNMEYLCNSCFYKWK